MNKTDEDEHASVLQHNLARNLLSIKTKNGWSEECIAKKSGISQKTINNILNQRHKTTLITIERLADALAITPLSLLCDEENALK